MIEREAHACLPLHRDADFAPLDAYRACGKLAIGKRIVAAVNGAGPRMDCSHTGRRRSLDIMAASARPVIFSHSNPLAMDVIETRPDR